MPLDFAISWLMMTSHLSLFDGRVIIQRSASAGALLA